MNGLQVRGWSGGLQRADALVGIPLIVGGKLVKMMVEVIPKSLDLLLSLQTCGKLGLVLDLGKEKATANGEPVHLSAHRAGHLMLNLFGLSKRQPWRLTLVLERLMKSFPVPK